MCHAPGKAQLGNPDWIRQQAAASRGSVEQAALDNQGSDSQTREHQEGRGQLPLRAEVQASPSRAQLSIGQVPTRACI